MPYKEDGRVIGEGSAFCTGHTSMVGPQMASYTESLNAQFREEFKLRHNLKKPTGPGRAQMTDWEAILAPSKEAFLQLALSWYLPVVGKAPHITEAPLEECTCCSNTCSEEDPWGAWGESDQRPGAGWGLDNGFTGSWRWAGLHTGDLQQVRTPLDMLKRLNFSDWDSSAGDADDDDGQRITVTFV